MTEYIAREALEYPYMTMTLWGLNTETCHAYNQGVKAVKEYIDSIPAADVVEVVHGHWISQQEAETINDYGKAYCCSICGHCDWDCTESESFNYCPHCGAKMDGGGANE